MPWTETPLATNQRAVGDNDGASPGNGQFALARTIEKTLGVFQARMGDAPRHPESEAPGATAS
jgi:hypothetical protein